VKKDVLQHVLKEMIEVDEIIPSHVDRGEASHLLFDQSRRQLLKDGHGKCFICGCTENLEAHHFGAEWCLEPDIDFDKLKEFLLLFDVYGYSAKMKDIPLTDVDDIRNLMILCTNHHIIKETGIHATVFPVWISQKLAKIGINTI
jgi:hypothetical protein